MALLKQRRASWDRWGTGRNNACFNHAARLTTSMRCAALECTARSTMRSRSALAHACNNLDTFGI
eukprot:12465451-Alexandrium_andersonii.AAC.1